MTSGQIPATGYSSLLDSLFNQIAATTGATPSTRPGPTISRNQATTNFGRLISASRLPASDSSERRLVLDASSSTSPRRGSMTGFKQCLRSQECAASQMFEHDHSTKQRPKARSAVIRFALVR